MIKPVGNRLLVKPHALEEVRPEYKAAKAAGIIIAETDSHKREQFAVDKGIVIAIGPNCWEDWGDKEFWCEVGDEILFVKHGGMIVREREEDEQHMVLLNDTDVVAVLTKEVE